VIFMAASSHMAAAADLDDDALTTASNAVVDLVRAGRLRCDMSVKGIRFLSPRPTDGWSGPRNK